MRTDQKFALRHRTLRKLLIASLATAVTAIGIVAAPSAAADATENLRAAVAAARGASSCGPLRSDPTVDQVAHLVNQSSDDWLNFASRAVPETDALPPLKDLGYPANTAAILTSATPDDGTSVKALILQGFAKISDCSYTSFGVATTYNDRKGIFVMTAVLAG
jgi:hypothetical protein